MTAEDIRWGRGGGRRLPKGVRPGEGLADIDEIRQAHGGTFDKTAPPTAAGDQQLDLFAGDGPPAEAAEAES